MADLDYSQLSDDELDAIINGTSSETPLNPVLGPALEARSERIAAEPEPVDTSYGMPGWQLGLAGMGADFADIGLGLKEKAQLAFAPEGKAGEDLRKKVAQERQHRAQLTEELRNNPEAVAGSVLGQVAGAASAPARIGAQMLLQGAMDFSRPGTTKETGIGGELINSILHGGVGAGVQGVVGKGLKLTGRGAGAATGQMTPEGEIALRTKEAATRLGLPPTRLGQLYPNSPMASVERALPGYSERVGSQAGALRTALDRPISVPEGEIPDVGRAYVDELSEAARARLNQGAERYRAVDQNIAANNLAPLTPSYSARVVASQGDPGYPVASEMLQRYGLDLSGMQGVPSSQLAKQPITFEDFHTARVAVNKALNTLDRGMASAERMGASIPSENRAAKNYLQQYKKALDRDAESWAAKHASNKDALDLYKDATAFYRDVVAPTVLDNPIARKATSQARGFKSGQEGLSAATSSAGIPMVDRLYPTMTRRGQDMTDVLRNLPDVRSTALSRDAVVPGTQGGLSQVLRAVTGHPLTAVETILSRIPGLGGLSESKLAARLVGAEDVLSGKAPTAWSPLQALQGRGIAGLRDRLAPRQGVLPRSAWAASQYPEQALEERVRRLSATR